MSKKHRLPCIYCNGKSKWWIFSDLLISINRQGPYNADIIQYSVIMQPFPPTLILRHRLENLKKCSLRGLESRQDCRFFTYPTSNLPDLKGYLMLAVGAPPLTRRDAGSGLFLIDATWRYAAKMLNFVDSHTVTERRSIPGGFKTAYPRRQEDCPNPEEGLASIEALYVAYVVLGRDPSGLLDGYYWKEAFLDINSALFKQLRSN